MAAKQFNCGNSTILRYARNGAVFQEKFILSLENYINIEVKQNFRKPVIKHIRKKYSKKIKPKISMTRGTTIYLYSVDLKLLETFTSVTKAGEYLNTYHKTILRYARSGASINFVADTYVSGTMKNP
jgi:hypothetical protein